MTLTTSKRESLATRSLIIRGCRFLFSRRGLRLVLIIFAWFITMIALFYGVENWRGRRAWNKIRQKLQADGVAIDFKSYIPKPVPPEQNFAEIPLVKLWFEPDGQAKNQGRWNDVYANVNGKPSLPGDGERRSQRHRGGSSVNSRQFTDLPGWESAFNAVRAGEMDAGKEFGKAPIDANSRIKAAPAVLAALQDCQTNLAPLRAASSMPYARYPVIYDAPNPWAILIPHLSNIKAACERLELKSAAELAADRVADASADVQLTLFLANSLNNEPFLVSHMVRIRCLQSAIQPIWEGLAEHRWSDSDLADLSKRLQSVDLFTNLQNCLNAERAAALLTIVLMQEKAQFDIIDGGGLAPGVANALSHLVPSGWFQSEKATYCRLLQDLVQTDFDASQKRFWPARIEQNDHEFERQLGPRFRRVLKHRITASLLLPALKNVSHRTAEAQVVLHQATLACALERYRLANGSYPATLQVLVPQFIPQLPRDVLSGEPYKYRPTSNGQFILYSVGWNEKDDGGTPGKSLFDSEIGDWLWQYN